MPISNIKMRFAIVNGERHLPEKGMHGTCPLCGAEVISKCGAVRIPHWAHKNLQDCDAWSEGKTDWHIEWQDKFPREWQEITISKNNIKHRADVCVPGDNGEHAAIIEFQHSYLEQEELNAREEFYPNLIWVVDVASKKRDKTRFFMNKSFIPNIDERGYILENSFLEKLFPKAWLNCTAPVFFDFANAGEPEGDVVYCLYPNFFAGKRFVACYPKVNFLDACKYKIIFLQMQNNVNEIEKLCQQEEVRNRALANVLRSGRGGWRSPRL